jgi:hypothetical protein
MLTSKSELASVLSSIIIGLTVTAAGGSLLFPDVYREGVISSGFNKAGMQGNDHVTLIVAVPLVIGALIFARRGSLRAQLVWLGMNYYLLYNYSFYLFGLAINWFFPIYAALFILPIVLLIFALPNIDLGDINRRFRPAASINWISVCMFLFTALLVVAWGAQWVNFMASGSLDAVMGDFIRTVAGLDFALLASGMLLGGILLWRRSPWGCVVAAMINISTAVYMLVLVMGLYTQAMAGLEGAATEIPLYGFLGVVCLIASLVLLRNLRPADR